MLNSKIINISGFILYNDSSFSGLTAGIDLKRKLDYKRFTIIDENSEIGGTWLVNTYPGCACDIPSHLYSWSFELNPGKPGYNFTM
jgi:cation diffusion facilitator CzcD-associated flavoprotein CzcO